MIWLLLILIGSPTSSGAATLDACAPLELARRTGSDSCWARFTLRSSEGKPAQLCISKALWRQWIQNPRQNLCGTWKGKWKVVSPPSNSEPTDKRTFLRFAASSLPLNHDPLTLRFRTQSAIELQRERLDAWLTPHDSTGVLRLLATGTRRPDGKLEFLMTLGFVHVLSASGIHLYALASIWGGTIQRIAPRAGLSVGGGLWFARIASFLSWTLCWLAAGARPGMLRPWLVVLMRRGATLAGMRWYRWAPLAIALGVDLIVAAWRHDLDFHSGRWIYALAVGGGMMANTHVGVAVGSWVLAALWQAHEENLVACATPLLSGLTLPIFSSLLYPLVYLSYVTHAEPVAAFCGWLSDHFIAQTSSLTMAARTLWILPHWALGAGMMLAFATLAFLSPRLRVVFLIVLALGHASWSRWVDPPSAWPPHQASQVEQLDVGQGDSALVDSGLIDTGSERTLPDAAWVRIFASRGLRRLSWIALTHLDEDHAGGVLKLARLVPIDCVATSQAQIDSPRGHRLARELQRAGVRLTNWEDGCVPYPVLGPETELRASRSKKGSANADMSALFVPLEGGGFYLNAGDADVRTELRIGSWAAALASTTSANARDMRSTAASAVDIRSNTPRILKISHHGSRTSTSKEFLELVRPTEAWISSGVGNSFGHPTAQVLELLAQERIPVRRTDLEGAIIYSSKRPPSTTRTSPVTQEASSLKK